MAHRPVYVVDDEEPIRRSVCLLLKANGFAAQAFAGGQDFLDVASRVETGCVLLDLRMPDLDGIAVQRCLNASEASHPTIVMTAHGDLGSAVAALREGAEAFIEKPFGKAQLLGALEVAFMKIERMDAYTDYVRNARARIQSLGDCERLILARLADDQSSDRISSELKLSPAEMDISRALILQGLGVETVPAALSIAYIAKRHIA